MIIIGYPGVGKSTLSKESLLYLDLESSIFNKSGLKDWHDTYTDLAVDLSNQGYNVFVSSHEVVQKDLSIYKEIDKSLEIISVFPSIDLEDKWNKKLSDRFESTNLIKDYKAYNYSKLHYVDSIIRLYDLSKKSGFKIRCINNMSYDLKALIETPDSLIDTSIP